MIEKITVEKATKIIGKRRVLDEVSFELPRGGVYGFLGVNGSGKTMLFRAISGLVYLTSGSIEVFGTKVGSGKCFPYGLGLVIDSPGFWDELTGFENLRLLASIRRVIGDRDIARALHRVGLDPGDKRTYSAYSMGMRQRLSIAQAIMEKPELIILDEPTNALDSDGIGLVLDIVREERDRNATILIACHNEPRLEELFDSRFHMTDGHIE